MRERELVGPVLCGPFQAKRNAIVEQCNNDRFGVVPILGKGFTRQRFVELCYVLLYHTTICEMALEAVLRAVAPRSKEIIFQGFQRLRLQPGKMTGILHFINQDLNNFVQGPGPFYVFSNEPPKLVQDIRDGDPRGEFLECAIWEDMPYLFGRTQFWRVSFDGKATYIRPFWEDRAPRPDLPDGWFSPLFLVRALAELTRHAYLFAQQFPSVHTVEFRCEWIGLQERAIWHPGIRGFFYYDGQIARSDRAITVAEALPTELLVDWPKTVSELGAPVLRLFNPGADFSPEWVAQQNLAV
jgi:hypothetical protein